MLSPNPPSFCPFHSPVPNSPRSHCPHQRIPLGMGRLAGLTSWFFAATHTSASSTLRREHSTPPLGKGRKFRATKPKSPHTHPVPAQGADRGPSIHPPFKTREASLAPEAKAAGPRAQRCALRPERGWRDPGFVSRGWERSRPSLSTWRKLNLLRGGYF